MVAHAKGSLLLHWRDYIHQRYGPELWKSILEQVPAADRSVLVSPVLVRGEWYPIGAWNRGIESFLGSLEEPEAVMRDLAAYVANRDLNSLFRVIMRASSPGFLVSRSQSIWDRYLDCGTLRPTEWARGHWRLTLEAPLGSDEGPARPTCGPGVCGWLEEGLRLTGASGSVRHTTCRLDENPACEYDIRW